MIDPVFLDTPLYRCEALEPGLGCTVSIKLETANPVRSFKARGTEVVASLPQRGQAKAATPNKKTARRRVSVFVICAVDQARRSADPFCFRRYAMKPTPMKPKIIMAQVDGSGTAAMIGAAAVKVPWILTVLPPIPSI